MHDPIPKPKTEDIKAIWRVGLVAFREERRRDPGTRNDLDAGQAAILAAFPDLAPEQVPRGRSPIVECRFFKRAVEAAMQGEGVAEVPTVESLPALASELRAAGFDVTAIGTEAVDVKALREGLGMSQEQFARRYGLELDAVQNWEQHRRRPEGTALRYLRTTQADPAGAARAQEVEVM